MSIQLSTRLANFIDGYGSLKQALTGCVLDLYTGNQPATADSAPTGTHLARLTLGGAAFTNEITARGSILLAGSSGSVSSITVGGAVSTSLASGVQLLKTAVPYNTSLAQTATDLVNAINANVTTPRYKAMVDATNSAKVILEAAPGIGNAVVTFAIAATSSPAGLTFTYAAFGTASAPCRTGVANVNGLTLGPPVAGVFLPTGLWQGVGLSSDTTGWGRFTGIATSQDPFSATNCAVTTDDFSDDSVHHYFIRMDGAVATDGTAEIYMPSAVVTSGAPVTINDPASNFTVPMA